MSDPNPFSPSATSQAVHATLDQALQSVPAGKRAVLLGRVDTNGDVITGSLMVAGKFGDHWEVAAGGGVDTHAKASGSIVVMGSW